MKYVILFALASFSLFGQIEKKDVGTLHGGTYQILIPQNWNKKLVMYAHGYQFQGQKPQESNVGLEKRLQVFLDRGFAIAASDYPAVGFVLPEGIDATEELRQAFVKNVGKPDSTFMVGHSKGGGITLGTMENFGENYHGALPLCPLASRPYLQCRKEYDMYATFNGLFPGIIPSLKDIFDINSSVGYVNLAQAGPKIGQIMKAIMEKDSTLAKAFAKKFDLKLKDLGGSLFFNQNVLRDIAVRLGGNPFDNLQTVYTGFPDDLLTNQVAERLPATKNPNLLFSRYDRTGNINKPVLLVHTIYDQLIPPSYAVVNYENMVHQQQKDQYFTVKYTNGQAHCAFTPQQMATSFDLLRNWVKNGVKPQGGFLK
ncbi:alpha/beta hydrolase [Aquirufa nivalisilvae]|uniref:alpha/beta hydrolase family protein n=1 Tax=Aquirufa nivalisilvae TaxID=2516557 RepID=UPI0022A8D61B|nr:alpha/beta hydrolase [Aquirufa nivalisilvae]MCZ2482537.1 alpha/beta hydrolase [Aquirufa nivalisilvae]